MPILLGTWLQKISQTSNSIKMIAAITSLCVVMSAVTGRQILLAHQESMAAGIRETQNLSLSLKQQIELVFQSSGMLLAELSDRWAADGNNPDGITKLEAIMRRRAKSDPNIHGMVVTDAQGKSIAAFIPSGPTPTNYADRSYFNERRTQNDTRLHIDGPVFSRVDHATILVLNQRLNHPDGSFAGIMLAALQTSVFDKIFSQIEIGPDGVINLSSDRGIIVARRPFDAENIGLDISNSLYFQKSYQSPSEYQVEYTSVIDGEIRIGTVNKIPNIKLQIGVMLPKNQILANWMRRTWSDLEILTSILIISSLISAIIWRQMRQKDAVDARYRLLAENSKDVIICLNEHGIRTFVSPSFWHMTGWKPEELEGTTALDIIHPDDRADVVEARRVAFMSQGENLQSTRYRYLLANGGNLWVECVAQQIKKQPDQPIEFVLNIRDIQKQMDSEAALFAANTRLTSLSMTDGLTGLANRRHFDDVFTHEWKRALRQQTPLGLLLIDVDRFKAFNDRYGHQAGDQCLINVANLLVAELGRPSDLVARYGGEEFAIVLADMPCEQLEPLAEKLRLALVHLGIAHECHDVGVVTISLGLAIITPQVNEDPKMLIDMADGALYQAKHAGRNRSVLAQRPILNVLYT